MSETPEKPAYLSPRIGSLCSGYGGLDLGLITALGGGSVAWHVEYDKHPSAVLDARFLGVPNYGDITTTDWREVEPVDWLTAGYPCQPFSHAGKRKGSADERHLWPAVARAIGVLRPGRVLLENVRGHVSLGLDAVLADLAGLGYDARWGVVPASAAGAPHERKRLFVAAADAGSAGAWRHCRAVSRQVAAIGWTGADLSSAGHGRDDAAAYATSDGRDEGRTEPAGQLGRPDAAECRDDAPADTDGLGLQGVGRLVSVGRDADRCGSADVAWGIYEPAIRRWEAVTGRPAPRPTEPGRTGERLSPRFVEWMQGLPDGWVTDILPRNPALKALGNGVVPQQAALAVSVLHHSEDVAA